MSHQATSWAWEQTTVTPTQKFVLVALADRHNHDTGLCCPSIARVAKDTGYSERGVRNALSSLVELGLLTRERRRRRDGSLGVYEYVFPALEESRGAAPPEPGAAGLAARGAGRNQEAPNQEESTTDVVLSRDDVDDVFAYWQTSRSKPRSKLTPNRRKKIEARLREFSVAELRLAIDGVGRDPWKDRHLHDDLVVIFRNGEQVEKFLALAAGTNGGGALDRARRLQAHIDQDRRAPR